MNQPFLLCDPALLLPPLPSSEISEHHAFWSRLLRWRADRRVKLGLESREVLILALTELGWPDHHPPTCPVALQRESRRAWNQLLAAVAPRPSSPPSDIPELDPAYVRDEDLGAAIALDAAGHADESLIGAATHTAHWAEHAEVVRVVPPPPEEMTLVTEPGVMTDRERDLMLARRLYEMRVTIVGGTHSDGTCRRLMDRFLLDPEQIRWIECEKGRQPPLESLRGIRKDHDVLVCITGAIGHAESEKTIRIGRRGGVEAIYVESASRIPEGLRNALLGS